MKYSQLTIILIALSTVNTRAVGQNSLNNPAASITAPSAACKANKDLIAIDLYGSWVFELSTGAANAPAISTRLIFKQNPEFAESLAGEFSLQGQRMEVFGDVEDGAVDFEESANGKDISAIWKGRVAEGSCGQAIMGTRSFVDTKMQQTFVMRRSGW